jgi:hypothetical protein
MSDDKRFVKLNWGCNDVLLASHRYSTGRFFRFFPIGSGGGSARQPRRLEKFQTLRKFRRIMHSPLAVMTCSMVAQAHLPQSEQWDWQMNVHLPHDARLSITPGTQGWHICKLLISQSEHRRDLRNQYFFNTHDFLVSGVLFPPPFGCCVRHVSSCL